MLSPLTLMWSVLALVPAERPLRTGGWSRVAAAFVLGGAAASHSGLNG